MVSEEAGEEYQAKGNISALKIVLNLLLNVMERDSFSGSYSDTML